MKQSIKTDQVPSAKCHTNKKYMIYAIIGRHIIKRFGDVAGSQFWQDGPFSSQHTK